MRRHHAYYRTGDGAADYAFSFEEQQDGTWRVYVDGQPSYQGRASGAHATHRLSDGGRKYICWTESLSTLDAAKQVAATWADKTQGYIRTGRTF